VIQSLVLLAVVYGLKHPQWKNAGRQSLIAHGLDALSANILKHVIGRPRPKFMHAGNLEFSPAGGSVRGRNRAGHKVPSSEMAHSRCGSGHRRQSDSPRVSLPDRRGRRSDPRLCHGSNCSPSLA